MTKPRIILALIASFLILTLIGGGWVIHRDHTFRLESSDPHLGAKIDPEQEQATVTFTQNINNRPKVSIIPETPGQVRYSNRSITFIPDSGFQAGKQYHLSIDGIKNHWGASRDVDLNFTTVFTPFNQQSETQQQSQIPEQDPPFEAPEE